MLVSRIIKGVSRSANTALVPKRTMMVGYPRERVSFPEKVALGLVLASVILAYPIYALSHMNEVRRHKGIIKD